MMEECDYDGVSGSVLVENICIMLSADCDHLYGDIEKISVRR